jgi:NTP pyrophosphatase (non-canonical NTP hydrolase)
MPYRQMSVIEELQREVAEWARHNFPNMERVLGVSAVAEEAGELLRAVRKQAQRIRGTRLQWDEEIMKEAGDVFIALCQAADTCEFDLDAAIRNRWAVVRQRDFVADPKGHGLPTTLAPLVRCRRCAGTVMVDQRFLTEHDELVHGMSTAQSLVDRGTAYDYEEEGLGGT